MDTLYWVLLANAAVWLGLGAYLACVAARGAALEKRLRHMEMLDDDN